MEKEEPKQDLPIVNGSYGCTIQTKEQETIEEVAERLYPEEWYWIEKKVFQEAAKWQQERMYSEEEVITILDSYNKYLKGITKEQSVEEWFEQFKKK